MRLSVDNKLIEAAQELAPIILKHAEEAERERRPAQAVMDGRCRAPTHVHPSVVRRLEADPFTYALVTETISGFHSIADWALQVGNSAAWWCARLTKEGFEEISRGNSNAIIAAAFHPPQQAVEVPGTAIASPGAALWQATSRTPTGCS